MPKKRIEPQLIEAAISLFGEFGFKGVKTRHLAVKADVMAYNINRLFDSKQGIYVKALSVVVDRSINEMADFVHNYPKSADKKDESSLVYAAVHRWYSSLSRDGARLLQQVMMSDPLRRDRAFGPMANIISIVTNSIEAPPKKAKSNFDPKTRAEALIMTLFQLKVSSPGPPDKEMREVDRFLGDWIKDNMADPRNRSRNLTAG